MIKHLTLPFVIISTLSKAVSDWLAKRPKKTLLANPRNFTSFDRLFLQAIPVELQDKWIDHSAYFEGVEGYFHPAIYADVAQISRFDHAGRRVVIVPRPGPYRSNMVFFETHSNSDRSISTQFEMRFPGGGGKLEIQTEVFERNCKLLGMHIKNILDKR